MNFIFIIKNKQSLNIPYSHNALSINIETPIHKELYLIVETTKKYTSFKCINSWQFIPLNCGYETIVVKDSKKITSWSLVSVTFSAEYSTASVELCQCEKLGTEELVVVGVEFLCVWTYTKEVRHDE